jgi:inorganic pyrophosphatase
MPNTLWHVLDQFVETSEIVIDRPKGSPHPRFPQIIYPMDYGYLSNTSGGDGHELDVWVGSIIEKPFDAIVCTADIYKRDAEIKLLLGCTAEEKEIIYHFYKTHGMGVMVIKREMN